MVSSQALSDCLYCSKALLTEDGFVRCSVTFALARELCEDYETGKLSVWKAPRENKKVPKMVKPREIKAKAVKPIRGRTNEKKSIPMF